ncbi:DNA polymerase epsilon subunit 4 isoform X3 [Panthera pardus]|uniref:DNA polymerase epsilon subunit 4 n=1 Tax=Panthera pardus TaxID=9691 RepID=A0A9V1F9L0_PANPR|nr:DNA polymerase epsilon subunit 4 isoform X3 [Panthera pardus]XP_049507747.1 DNA polymerase epsilon subunit 4 isoform X1 [Panthera uncia]
MAAAAAGNGTPREEEGPSGEAAAPPPQAPTSVPGARLSRLPLARVKALVKADPDVTLAGQEAIFILARAAELFVETIAKDAYCCAQQGKRKTLQRRDLDNAIEAVDEFAFLEERARMLEREGQREGERERIPRIQYCQLNAGFNMS